MSHVENISSHQKPITLTSLSLTYFLTYTEIHVFKALNSFCANEAKVFSGPCIRFLLV